MLCTWPKRNIYKKAYLPGRLNSGWGWGCPCPWFDVEIVYVILSNISILFFFWFIPECGLENNASKMSNFERKKINVQSIDSKWTAHFCIWNGKAYDGPWTYQHLLVINRRLIIERTVRSLLGQDIPDPGAHNLLIYVVVFLSFTKHPEHECGQPTVCQTSKNKFVGRQLWKIIYLCINQMIFW